MAFSEYMNSKQHLKAQMPPASTCNELCTCFHEFFKYKSTNFLLQILCTFVFIISKVGKEKSNYIWRNELIGADITKSLESQKGGELNFKTTFSIYVDNDLQEVARSQLKNFVKSVAEV